MFVINYFNRSLTLSFLSLSLSLQTCGEFWSLVYDHECSAVVVLCQPPHNSVRYTIVIGKIDGWEKNIILFFLTFCVI